MICRWKVSAEEEYKRHPELKRGDVQAIQKWIRSTTHLPVIDEETVCHFLHASFYNVEKAKNNIEKFHEFRNKMPKFFDDWDPTLPEIQNMINNVIITAPLPEPDQDGNRIILCKLKDSSADKFNYPAFVKWISMLCLYFLWEQGIQPGYVMLHDVAGYTMSHFFKCSMTDLKNQSEFGKEATPMRIMKIVSINTSLVVKMIHNLVKPFLPKELVKLISIYTDAESYFQTLPKDAVPEDYGGNGPSTEEIHRKYVNALMEHRDLIMAEVNIHTKKSKNARNSKEENSHKK